MNRELESNHQPVILEGEIIAPRSSGDRAHDQEQPRVHVLKMGWFGKTLAVLVMLALFAAIILLAAGALLIMLPVALIGAIWGWWRIRKLRT